MNRPELAVLEAPSLRGSPDHAIQSNSFGLLAVARGDRRGLVVCALGVPPWSSRASTFCKNNIAHLYIDAIQGYNDCHHIMSGDKWILLHAAVSVLLAVVATVIHHSGPKRSEPDYQPDSKTFTLASLLLIVTAVSCVFSLLACLGAIYAVYLVVLIFVAGRFAVLLLAAVGL